VHMVAVHTPVGVMYYSIATIFGEVKQYITQVMLDFILDMLVVINGLPLEVFGTDNKYS